MGFGDESATESQVAAPVPVAGTITTIAGRVNTVTPSPGGSTESVLFTLYKNAVRQA